MASLDPEAIAAWTHLIDLGHRRMVVRKAYETLVQIQGYPSVDATGYFGAYRNFDALYDGPKAPTIPSDPVANSSGRSRSAEA